MSSVEINGRPCSSALLTIPGFGLWYATVDVVDAIELAGAVALKFLDTTWFGTIIAGGVVDGKARYRVVAGAGGWGKVLPPKAYANDAGLQMARLINDAAAEAGELPPVLPPTTTLGPHFDRPRGPASFVLNLLVPRFWFANSAGQIIFDGIRDLPARDLPVVSRNPAGQVVELAIASSASGLVPGVLTEFGAAQDVELELGPDGLRARLYAGPAPNRRAQAWARLSASTDPGARFRGVFEYRVVTQEGERLNLQPVRSRADMPDLARVPVRAGVPGVKARHALGSQVLVAFLDGDASRPAVVGFDAPDSVGWMPLLLELGGPGALGVARQTDPVQAGAFSGVVVSGSARVKAVL